MTFEGNLLLTNKHCSTAKALENRRQKAAELLCQDGILKLAETDWCYLQNEARTDYDAGSEGQLPMNFNMGACPAQEATRQKGRQSYKV